MSVYEIAGKVALQLVPAGMGAVLARSQLGLRDEENGDEEVRRESYVGELFLMAAGALFLAFNVAPTEEIVLIAHQQASPWYGLALLLVSILLLHAFVYAVGFSGQHSPPEDRGSRHEFVRLTLPGYAIVLAICTYVLWTFGRLDGLPPLPAVQLDPGPGVSGGIGCRHRTAGAVMPSTRRSSAPWASPAVLSSSPSPAISCLPPGRARAAGCRRSRWHSGRHRPWAVAGWVVPFSAVNQGSAPASALGLEAVLALPDGRLERSEVVVDYLASGAEQSGGFFFTADPAQGSLMARPLGYVRP